MKTVPSVKYFRDAAAFRRWLEKNHARETELWVGFYKKGAERTGITYREALDQALCFGWIDGILHRVDDERYTHRFTPRKTKSTWSDANIRRVAELKKLGLMQPAGLAAFARRTGERSGVYAHEKPAARLSRDFAARLKANRKASAYFDAQTASYRRLAVAWVMSAKREETRERRLESLIADCAAGRWIKPLRWQKPDRKKDQEGGRGR